MVQTVHPLVLLAREAIKTYLEKGKVLHLPDVLTNTTPMSGSLTKDNGNPPLTKGGHGGVFSSEMRKKNGVFVSLKIKGRLRGCIGTFEPSYSNVAEEVIHNAISSATKDPRFMPVTLSELENIDISVDVLTAPEPIKSADELDPEKYGVIVKNGYKRGLLLPDLEGVDTVEEQIEIAKSKAGIGKGEAIELFRFEVRRFK